MCVMIDIMCLLLSSMTSSNYPMKVINIYSRLNILVNEINELGLMPIEDDQVVRRILETLLPKYKLIVSIIYDNNDIKKMTPSQVLGKITDHEITMNMKVEASFSSDTKNLAFTSKKAQY